jgi:DNA-binding GntR family transcriptional regulator
VDDGLTEVQVAAIRTVCGQLTAAQLPDLRRNVEQACLLPKRPGWDRKAAAHAEIFGLLADAAGNPVRAQALRSSARLAHRLMVTAGPGVADGITANSRKRFLAYLSAGDSEGAAREMEGHLRVLSFLGRLCRPRTVIGASGAQ